MGVYRLNDCLKRIENASLQKKSQVIVFKNKLVILVLYFLYKEGYINGFSILNTTQIVVFLKYVENKPMFKKFKIFLKPGRKTYMKWNEITKYYKNNMNISSKFVLSTSNGIMNLTQSYMKKFGGLLLFKII